jgi:glycosyltransferase involved in cell wall biosynthesis
MLISVVVPTHNRHLLLREAIASLETQNYTSWELIVVDDGSDPPVVLDERVSPDSNRVRLLRNHQARGPSGARNAGIEAASGDLVTFLDDDDLLACNALELIAAAFRDREDLDCLFVNVDPFGELAEGTRENQTNTVRRILEDLGVDARTTTGTLALPANLFEILLDGVPMAFQRVAIRRSALSRVGRYAGRGFEDIEFYFRVALRCSCALLADAVYRPRCAGQSYFTRSEAKAGLIEASIRIREGLLKLPEVSASPDLRRRVRRTLANARFEKAYFAYETGQAFPWRDYFASCATGIAWPHLSILVKNLARLVSGKKLVGTRI